MSESLGAPLLQHNDACERHESVDCVGNADSVHDSDVTAGDSDNDSEARATTHPVAVPLWKRAAASAFRGGISGFIAMVAQVLFLMWLRTAMNYQYKTGVGIAEVFRTLYEEGGVRRFYHGLWLALLIAPIAKFGDTAANQGITELFSASDLPVWFVTFLASLVAALWRVVITPMDMVKTNLQVSGATGWKHLMVKIHTYGVFVLWEGAFGNFVGNIFGNYPWWAVNNWLEVRIPPPVPPHPIDENTSIDNHKNDEERHRYQRSKVIRRSFIGFCASFVATCISNGFRVVTTYQQTSADHMTYFGALVKLFYESGVFFVLRGLGLGLICNCLGGIIFSVLWKMLMDHIYISNSDTSSVTMTTVPTQTA